MQDVAEPMRDSKAGQALDRSLAKFTPAEDMGGRSMQHETRWRVVAAIGVALVYILIAALFANA